MLLEHAEISIWWSSHDSVGATAVPLMTTKMNGPNRRLVLAMGANLCIFQKRRTVSLSSVTVMSSDTVTLDTICRADFGFRSAVFSKLGSRTVNGPARRRDALHHCAGTPRHATKTKLRLSSAGNLPAVVAASSPPLPAEPENCPRIARQSRAV